MSERTPTTDSDVRESTTIRPASFDDFVGQKRLITKLKIAISAAQQRDSPIEHLFLAGPAGFGKTSLAFIIANAFKKQPVVINGATIESRADIVKSVLRLRHGDIMFIDEFHAIQQKHQDLLLSILEDFKLYLNDNTNSEGVIPINLSRFTLIAATTHPGKLSAPLKDRFGIYHTMEMYDDTEICQILRQNSEKMKTPIANDRVIEKVAVAARGTPRLANRVLKRLGDIMLIRGKTTIDDDVANEFFKIESLSHDGLGPDDVKYIVRLYSTGSSVGLQSMSSILNIDIDTVSQKIEPFLLHSGFIVRKRSGRALTPKGIDRATRELSGNGNGPKN